MKINKYFLGLLFLIFGLVALQKPGLAKEPKEIVLGTYLTSLYDINSDRGTFSADMWIGQSLG